MNDSVPAVRVVASALLGVVAASGVAAAAFLVFGAWVMRSEMDGIAGDIGPTAALLVAGLILALALVAGLAARDVFAARARGAVLGLVVGFVTLLGAVAAIVRGSTADDPLLFLAATIGAVTVVGVLVAAAAPSPRPRQT